MTETERQVEGHLASHLDRLPANDQRSRQIVELMKTDEAAHAQAARARGAAELPGTDPDADARSRARHDRHRLLDLSAAA